MAVIEASYDEVFGVATRVGRRVRLAGRDLYINLGPDGAELTASSLDNHQSMRLTLPEANELVRCALMACSNKDLREIRVRDLTFRVDARVERTPQNIFQKLFFLIVTPRQMIVVIRANTIQLDAVLNRAIFEAGLRESADLLTVLGERVERKPDV